MAPLLLALAPLLQQLAANGLGLIGNAVIAKGKDFIEEKLGVKIEDAVQTEEGKLKLLQLQSDHEEFLLNAALENRKVDLDFYRADADDRSGARDMNARIQESHDASWLAKNGAYVLDYIIVVSTVLMGYLLFFKQIPDDNIQIANIMFGSLLALCGTVVQFHRGSSSNNQSKDKTIANLAAKGQP